MPGMIRHLLAVAVLVSTCWSLAGCETTTDQPTRPGPSASEKPKTAPETDTPRAPRSPLAPAFTDGPIRGLWITRWDYRTPADLTEAIDRAATLGITDIFWQVRGAADAFYASPFEPWGQELLEDLPEGATEPGFDPLELAVVQAHARGLRLHAWVNVMPLWKGRTPPKSPRHPYYTHPEWRLVDTNGTPQPLSDHYVIINPVLDETQDYLVRVMADLVDRYAIDGLHLDYIRFVSETMDKSKTYPGDAKSLGLFAADSGRSGIRTDDDRRAFRAWKRNRITNLVRRIRTEAVGGHPGVVLTAAVWRDPTIGQVTYLQDGDLWLREGTLDAAIPMIYTDKDQQLRDDWRAWQQAASGARIIPGLGVYKHEDPSQTIRQIRIAASPDGYALFAYASLFDSANPLEDMSPDARAQRRQRRTGLERFIDRANKRSGNP
jgi:uncharacterized lipoprotein YddW (UPF0748 family)